MPHPLKSPMTIAFLGALSLVGSLSLALYLNEDWRTIALDMVEETVTEEGKVVRKVKVERPEPNREQIREVTEERERKKREDIREKARKVRETVVEMAEVVEERESTMEELDEWDLLASMALDLRRSASERYAEVRHSYLDRISGSREAVTDLKDEAVANAHDMRLLSLSDNVTRVAVWERVAAARRILKKGEDLETLLLEGIEEQDNPKTRRLLTDRMPPFNDFITETETYLNALERWVKDEIPPDETLAAEDPEAAEADPTEPPPEAENPELADAEAENEPPPPSDWLDELPAEEDLEKMSTAELYESLQEMAETVDELYAENLARELAEFKKIPLEEAREQVHKPKTDSGPDLKSTLEKNNPSNREEFREFNEALEKASDAAGRIARTAETRQSRVGGNGGREGEKQTADQLQSALRKGREINAEMAKSARNRGNENGNVTDMRNAMSQAYALQAKSSGSGGGGGGSAGGYSSAFGQSRTGGGGKNQVNLSSNRVFAKAVPGRRFDQGSTRRGWIFLDTWYIIGPWDRPNVDSFDTTFPPETAVDLDATYEGKTHPRTGKPMELEWRFVQSENVRINPPDETRDAVYYAYTEVFSETAMDILVAIGADDASKVWINDLLVNQDDGLSGWQPDEGFRRVLLKPGYNTVLVRVENGPAVCYFSVIMCPDDVLEE